MQIETLEVWMFLESSGKFLSWISYLGGWTLAVDTEHYCDAVTLQEQTLSVCSTTAVRTVILHIMSYRNVCWGRDDDKMEAAGGPAHSGCYLSRRL